MPIYVFKLESQFFFGLLNDVETILIRFFSPPLRGTHSIRAPSLFNNLNLGVDNPSSSQTRRPDIAEMAPTTHRSRDIPELPVLLKHTLVS